MEDRYLIRRFPYKTWGKEGGSVGISIALDSKIEGSEYCFIYKRQDGKELALVPEKINPPIDDNWELRQKRPRKLRSIGRGGVYKDIIIPFQYHVKPGDEYYQYQGDSRTVYLVKKDR